MNDEAARHRLYDRLVDVLGEEPAATLMRYLPPTEPAEPATRIDVQEVRTELREVRTELRGLRTEFRSELHEVRSELQARIERLEDRLDQQARTFVVTSIGSLATLGALAFAAASLV